MFESLEKVLMPLAEAIGKNKYLVSIRDGFLVSTPLLIVGSFFLLIANFPISQWTDWLSTLSINGVAFTTFLTKPTAATFDIMAVFAVIGIGYSFGKQMKINPIFGSAVAVLSWFILMPYIVNGSITSFVTKAGETIDLAEKASVSVSGIPLNWVGAKGIFMGIICAFSSVHIYSFVEKRGWVIKMPAGVPPTVVQSFGALIPAAIVMIIFFIINILFALTPWGNAFDFIFQILQTPLLGLGGTLGAMVIAYIFLHLFWFFGVNGGSVVGAVYNPILQTLAAENLNAFKAGLPMPNIVSQQFQDLFATFGGAGSTLSLLIAMLLFCKSKRIKELGKLSLVPGIFGINEQLFSGYQLY